MSDSPTAPPPYELSPQELDRKVDAALEESISLLSNSGEEEIWEDWDEARFQAAAQAACLDKDAGNSSSASNQAGPYLHTFEKDHFALPNAQPLRINKKAKVPLPSISSKDRPSWFEEAGLGGSGSSSTFRQEDARLSPLTHTSVSSPSSFTTQQFSLQLTPDEEEDRSIAPPPFTAVGPSLDGPPFEEIDSTAYVNNAHTYVSPPPSPLVSPTASHPPHRLPLRPTSLASPLLQPESRYSPPRQSLPASRPYSKLSPRPASSTGSTMLRPFLTTPIVGFDPSVAYTKPGLSTSPGVQPRGNEVASFYNHTVTAHLTNGPSRPSFANTVAYPSHRFRPSSSNSTLFDNHDWARNLYEQYPSYPTNPTLPVPPVLPAASEQPLYQYQPQPDPRLRPTSLQGQWRPQ